MIGNYGRKSPCDVQGEINSTTRIVCQIKADGIPGITAPAIVKKEHDLYPNPAAVSVPNHNLSGAIEQGWTTVSGG